MRCEARLLGILTLLLVACPCIARAQGAYPTKPIRLITPFAPGGSTTAVGRVIGQKLTDSWGQNVILDNRPGGNMIIGTEALAKAAPDGYTLLLTTNAHVINPSLFAKLPYDPIKDFAPVGNVYSSEFVLVINPTLPANNLQELIALAKAKPGQLNYATTGAGGSGHLANEMFAMLAGIKTQHIPYKGAGPAMVDLIGGQIQMFINNPLTVIGHIRNGRMKGIAVTGAARMPALPQVPTFTEAGLPGMEVKPWFCVLAPAGTPKAIIDKLSTEIARIVASIEVQDFLAKQGMDPFSSTPEQLSALMKSDMARWAKFIKAANIRLDN
jgi:tripartite-type tricarboxylate transporter receptor subunit TctC